MIETKDDYPDRDKFDLFNEKNNDNKREMKRNILSLSNINSNLDEILAESDHSKREETDKNFKISNVDIVYISTLETIISTCIISNISEIRSLLEILYMIRVDLKSKDVNYLNIVKKIIKDPLYNKNYVYNYLCGIDENYADYIELMG